MAENDGADKGNSNRRLRSCLLRDFSQKPSESHTELEVRKDKV